MNHSDEIRIALSAGGKSAELAAHGLGTEHIDELMVRLARKLLKDGHRLAFGGTIGVSGQTLTENLIDAALSWLDEDSARKSDVKEPETWPLVNYSAWPFYKQVTNERRAQLVGVCRFVDVDPPSISQPELTASVDDLSVNPQARLHAADALTAMREQSAQETDLRIVWGGVFQGAKGWMAGILEEVALSLWHDKPVLVLGGLGGCARLLADFLLDANAPWPEDLSLKASEDRERDHLHSATARGEQEARFEAFKQRFAEYRSAIHSQERVHGISTELLRQALVESSSSRVLGLAASAAQQCRGKR